MKEAVHWFTFQGMPVSSGTSKSLQTTNQSMDLVYVAQV